MSEDLVVALVLLRPASGRPLTGASRVTAETLEQYAPDPADAESVAGALREQGFEDGRRELPLERLPPALADRVAAATFEEPAEPVP